MSQIITPQDAMAIAIIGSLAITFIMFTLRYLNSESKPHYIDFLKIFLGLPFSKNLDRIKILDTLKLNLKNQKKEITKIKNDIYELNESLKLKQRTIERLNKYLLKLERKANFNLVYGLFFCITGIGFIFYSMMTYTPTVDENLRNSLIYFIPRITLKILIEIFSYFFLNLYKKI